MKKIHKYEVVREIDFIEVNNDPKCNIVVFKELISTPYYTRTSQGFCDKKEINNLSKNESIEELNSILLPNSFIHSYSLSLPEEHGYFPPSKAIKCPYDYIEKAGMQDVSLCNFNWDKNTLYDIKKRIIPRGILVNYMTGNGGMVDDKYNLESVLLKIKDLPRVRFIRESDKTILTSQSYMPTSKCSKGYLEFIVALDAEEYSIFIKRKKDKFKYLFDEVLDLSDLKK